MKKTVDFKQAVQAWCDERGYKIGCYAEQLQDLSTRYQKKVLESLNEEYTDVKVKLDGVAYVVEIATVDNEKDIMLVSAREHNSRYGS